jgi:hypothetical protein
VATSLHHQSTAEFLRTIAISVSYSCISSEQIKTNCSTELVTNSHCNVTNVNKFDLVVPNNGNSPCALNLVSMSGFEPSHWLLVRGLGSKFGAQLGTSPAKQRNEIS